MVRLTAALLAIAFSFSAASTRAACVVGKLAALPVTVVALRPSVEVKLDGKPVRLVVDSGSFFGDLSLTAVTDLGLKTYFAPSNLELVRSDGSTSRVTLVRVKSFGFADVVVPNVEFLVTGGAHQGEMGVEGVLGRNVLSYVDTEYDFAHGQLRLVAPKDCGDRSLAYWSSDPSVLPMRIEAAGATQVEAFVKINGADLLARFDTGRAYTTLTRSGARKAGLDVHGPAAKPAGVTYARDGKATETWLLPVSEVRIGDEIIRNTKVRASDSTATADVLIGSDFFLSHRVYVANSQRKIYFTYNGGPVFDLSTKPIAAPPPEPVATPSTGSPTPAPSPSSTSTSTSTSGQSVASSPQQGDEPTDAEGYSRRGQAFVARHDDVHALADLTRAVELEPQNPRYLRERAQLRLQTRQPFLAMQDLDAALKLAPDDAETHLIRARLRAAGRDRAGEEADLDAADHAAPKQADLRLGLGSMYSALDRYDRAVAQFDLWLSFHGGDSREGSALNGRCWARALAGSQLDQALRDCDAALRLQPKAAAYFDSRGLVRLKRGELERARGDYDAALAPKQPLALYARGVVRTRQGDATGGQADIAAATALNAQIAEQARRIGLAT